MLKEINGYDGWYAISDEGHVYSYISNKYLKEQIDNNGYHNITLSNGIYKKTYKIHRLVAQYFLDNPNQYTEVNHIDENKSNNCFSNLEWCDRKYNINYGKRTEKQKEKISHGKSYRAKKCYCIELNEWKDCASDWAYVIFQNPTQSQKNHIIEAANGRRKTAYGYHFVYENNFKAGE